MKRIFKISPPILLLILFITPNINLHVLASTQTVNTIPKYMHKVSLPVWDIKQFKDKSYIGINDVTKSSLLKSDSFDKFEDLTITSNELFYGYQDGNYTYIKKNYLSNRPVEAFFRAKKENIEVPKFVERINLDTGIKENYFFDTTKYENAYNTLSNYYKSKYNLSKEITFEVSDMNLCDNWFIFYVDENFRQDYGVYNIDTNDVHYFEGWLSNSSFIYAKELSNGTVRIPEIDYNTTLYIENNKVRKIQSNVSKLTHISNTGEFAVYQNWRGGTYNESILYKFNGYDYDIVKITDTTGPITIDSNGIPWTCIYESNKAYVSKFENDKFIKKYEVSPLINASEYQLFLSVYDDNNLIVSNHSIGVGYDTNEWVTIISDSWNKANPDINRDGITDILDISLVASEYNNKKNDVLWNSSLDFNSDDIIDLYDIIHVSKNIISF